MVAAITKRWGLALWIFCSLVFAFSAWTHQVRGGGRDFNAYYKAGERLLQGSAFYVDELDYAFKYAPITVLPFGARALGPQSVARWIYCLLHWSLACAIPVGLWGLLRSRTDAKTFWTGVAVAFLGSARFIDGEFRDSNFGLFVTSGLIASAYLILRPRFAWAAPLALAVSSAAKVHSLVCLITFRLRDPRTLRALILAAVILLFIPNPLLWPKWWEQMQLTAKYQSVTAQGFTLQGFFPLAARFLGWDARSLVSLVLAAPFALWAFLRLPRFSLAQAGRQPVLFFFTATLWVLWALMSSPLPWQHTYTLLWAIFPTAWVLASSGERKWLLGLAAFLGLSPRDLVGQRAFEIIESNQGVFLAILIVWVLCVRIASRYKLGDETVGTPSTAA